MALESRESAFLKHSGDFAKKNTLLPFMVRICLYPNRTFEKSIEPASKTKIDIIMNREAKLSKDQKKEGKENERTSRSR